MSETEAYDTLRNNVNLWVSVHVFLAFEIKDLIIDEDNPNLQAAVVIDTPSARRGSEGVTLGSKK